MIDVQIGATTILIASVSALAISILIIVTLRLSDFDAIRERLSSNGYDILYNGTLLSIILGLIPFVISMILIFYGNKVLFVISSVFLGFQLLSVTIASIRVLLPFKNKKHRVTSEDYLTSRSETLKKIADNLDKLVTQRNEKSA